MSIDNAVEMKWTTEWKKWKKKEPFKSSFTINTYDVMAHKLGENVIEMENSINVYVYLR